jgi:hypothetical protein
VSADGTFWRKKRAGVEYGSWHTYQGGRIVNLHTSLSLEDAKARAAKLAAVVGSSNPPLPDPPAVKPTAAGSESGGARRRRSPLRSWAVAEEVRRPPPPPVAPPATPAPPPKPELSEALKGLAAGMAGTLAKLNAVAAALAMRLARKADKAPPVDKDEIDGLERTYDTALKEMLLLQGFQWWHALAIQNATMLVRMYGDTEPSSAAPPTLRPVASASNT